VTAVTPRAHSPWGASQAHRWMECPGSIRLGRGMPDIPSSHYAKEGQCAHHVAELCLADGRGNAVDYIGREFEGVEVTEEMAEAVQTYINVVRADKATLGGKLIVEHKFDLTQLHEGLYGTNDAMLFAEREPVLFVYDYKHGAGVPVDVTDNPQLRYYGLGGVLTMKLPKIEWVELVIVQPRCNHIDGPVRRERIRLVDLVEWATELVAAIKRTMLPDAPLKAGEHCKWCKASVECPELRSVAERVAQVDFAAFKAPPAPETINISQLLQVLARADVVEQWLNDVRAHAEKMLESGINLPGWKLAAKRATRKYKLPEDDIRKALIEDFGLEEREILTEPELKSPAQIEKLLKGEAKKRINTLCIKESSGYVLAPESDPRPAMLPPAVQDFQAFLPSAAQEGKSV